MQFSPPFTFPDKVPCWSPSPSPMQRVGTPDLVKVLGVAKTPLHNRNRKMFEMNYVYDMYVVIS